MGTTGRKGGRTPRNERAPRDRDKGGAAAGRSRFIAGVNDLALKADAADDAWITCLIVLEKLQKPSLTLRQATVLLAELAKHYDRFRQALLPVEQLIAENTAP